MKKILALLVILAMLSGTVGATITTLTPVSLTELNDWSRMKTAWTAILGNGSYVNVEMAPGYDYYMLVNVTSYDVTDKTVDVLNVMAGDNPPAFRESLGNLSITMDDISTVGVIVVGPLETSRFQNSTGYCNIGSYMISGTYIALKVPR